MKINDTMIIVYIVVAVITTVAQETQDSIVSTTDYELPWYVSASSTLKPFYTTTQAPKAEFMFQNYGFPRQRDLPVLNRKIFKGTRVSIREHPYIVSIRRQYSHYLPGALVGNNLILTVAHPLYRVPLEELGVVSGENYSDRGTSLNIIAFIVIHQGFNPNTLVNDISILRTSEDFSYASNVKPIGLNIKSPMLGSQAFVTGWGRCDFTGQELCLPRSSVFYPQEVHDPMLRTITFTLTNNSYCLEYAKNDVPLHRGMKCEGVSRLEESMTSCLAVPGAPQVVNGKLTGILSWGFGCGYSFDMPLVYVDVDYYKPWILKNMLTMYKISTRNLTIFKLATKAYIMQQWANKTNQIYQQLIEDDYDLKLLDIDSTLASLTGSVYDLRDFIYNGKYHIQKNNLYANLKRSQMYVNTIKRNNYSRPTFPFLSSERIAYDVINNERVSSEKDYS